MICLSWILSLMVGEVIPLDIDDTKGKATLLVQFLIIHSLIQRIVPNPCFIIIFSSCNTLLPGRSGIVFKHNGHSSAAMGDAFGGCHGLHLSAHAQWEIDMVVS